MEGKLKILIDAGSFYPRIGGMESLLRMLAETLFDLGHEILLVSNTAESREYVFPFRLTVLPTAFQMHYLCRASDVVLASPLSLRRIGPQLSSRTPVVVAHPNPIRRADGRRGPVEYAKLLLSRCVTNVVPSHYMASEIPSSIVVPNSYDDRIFRPELRQKARDILFVGRLVPVKGCDVVIQALARLVPLLPEVSLTIVGSGSDRPNLERLVADLDLCAQVRFLGPRHGPELADIMRAHHVMVVPSRYREPFGIVALEGLASGCIVIVSREGGLQEAVGAHGLTFQNGDARELAERIKTALCDQAAVGALLEGVEAHLARHRRTSVANAYLDILKASIAAKRWWHPK